MREILTPAQYTDRLAQAEEVADTAYAARQRGDDGTADGQRAVALAALLQLEDVQVRGTSRFVGPLRALNTALVEYARKA